ncbi:flagellar hook-length control protein FliK [Sphingobium olei]|uniref:Flagellar hook-length control protein FliK n=2 Tax=Sphingobium olei TaxID=420955 RepID=A0ABW3P549_9SPHN|nr:flagellar hook-length control protein FliK [Sphingobium sp.]
MLTSLKALLFPATGVGQAPAGNAVAAEGIDFSALLNGVTDMPKAAGGQAAAPVNVDTVGGTAPVLLTPELSQDAPIAPLPVIADAAPPLDSAPDAFMGDEIHPPLPESALVAAPLPVIAEAASPFDRAPEVRVVEESHPLLPESTPLVDETHPSLVAPTAEEAGEPPAPVSGTAGTTLPDTLLPPASEQVPFAEIAPKLSKAAAHYQAGSSVGLAISPPDDAASEDAVGQGGTVQQKDAPSADVHDGPPNAIAAPQLFAPLAAPSDFAIADPIGTTPAALTAVSADVRAGPVSSNIPAESGRALPQTSQESASAAPFEAFEMVAPIAAEAASVEGADAKAISTSSASTEIPLAPRNAGPVPGRGGDVPPHAVPAPAVPTTLQPVQAASAPTPSAAGPAITPAAQPGSDAVAPIADKAMAVQERPAVPDMIEPRATHAVSRPSIAEALSLLQLARDQLRDRTGDANRALPERSGDSAALAPIGTDRPFMPVMTQHVVTSPATPQVIAAPAMIDLSASLGAQVVDMGVSGQWIDGLARDIASFSADGAQGRFRIDAGQLGPVQVDIRQGVDGAAVSLTVASDVAEQMLRQEGDRLKLDAGLAAVRISDVKVERAHVVAEPSRSDGAGAQSSGQQSTGSQAQGGAWTMQGQGWGQSSAQSHMQGRGQGRENFGAGAKSGGDPAVLNHEQSGGGAAEPPRARYA